MTNVTLRVGAVVLIAAVAVMAASCSSISVNADFDPKVDFSGLRTWTWAAATATGPGKPLLASSLVESRIRDAVERELSSRGFRVADGEPDFTIGYGLSYEDKLDVQTFQDYYGYGYWDGYGATRTQVSQYEEGTLILDIADPASNQLMWRGWARGRLRKNPSPEETTADVNEAVAAILAQFPPAAR